MNEDVEKSLLLNFDDFIGSAERDFKNNKYNPAVSNYFKAIAILCDWKIYKERRLLPKNHSERFHFLELHFKSAYELVSPLFRKYTDSYNIRLNKEDALLLKKNVEELRKIFGY